MNPRPTLPAPAALSDEALDAARRTLAALREDYLARYGAAIFEVSADRDASGIRLTGTVLLPAQRSAALSAVGAATDVPIDDQIDCLTERDGVDAWYMPRGPVADILSRPDGDLSTQVVPGDAPLRWLANWGDWWAIELADGTVGWTRPADCAQLAGAPPQDLAHWRAAWRGQATPADEVTWRAALAAWWGVPYRWGGNSPAGIDCSGLTQRVVKAALGLGLPKHSADQLKCGERIALSALAVGDLVGLTHIERRIGHIGVVVHSAPLMLAHASLERGVSEEPLDAVLARYQFRAARRLVEASTE